MSNFTVPQNSLKRFVKPRLEKEKGLWPVEEILQQLLYKVELRTKCQAKSHWTSHVQSDSAMDNVILFLNMTLSCGLWSTISVS